MHKNSKQIVRFIFDFIYWINKDLGPRDAGQGWFIPDSLYLIVLMEIIRDLFIYLFFFTPYFS